MMQTQLNFTQLPILRPKSINNKRIKFIPLNFTQLPILRPKSINHKRIKFIPAELFLMCPKA